MRRSENNHAGRRVCVMRRSWFWLLFFVVACCVFIFAVGAEVSAEQLIGHAAY